MQEDNFLLGFKEKVILEIQKFSIIFFTTNEMKHREFVIRTISFLHEFINNTIFSYFCLKNNEWYITHNNELMIIHLKLIWDALNPWITTCHRGT